MSHPTPKPAGSRARRLAGHVILDTKSHQAGCETTARVWAINTSVVIGGDSYESTISRVPVGQSHLCFVDCRVPMDVAAEGNATRAMVYLPLEGSMEIEAGGMLLRSQPGGPAFVPSKTAISFRATPIRCLLWEVPARKLRAELAAWDIVDAGLFPLAFSPGTPDARAMSDLLHFALADLERLAG